MKLQIKTITCILLFVVLQFSGLWHANAATAPTIPVKGIVVDVEGAPVIGAAVIEKGTTNGAVADVNGNFSLRVAEGATLEVTCIGYATTEVKAAADVRVVLEVDNLTLNETVVVGYGTQRVATVTGSVSQVNSEKLNTVPVGNTTHTLAGQLPGLTTKQTSGLPGQDDASLQIRNFGSPLVIVDGAEGSISNLDPGQIESISILKDGSGSIYGARAGNGVILVTTKSGANQKPTVSINSSVTMTGSISAVKPANSFQRAQMSNDRSIETGGQPSYTEEELEKFKVGTDPDYLNSDWYGTVVRPLTPQQNHNISVSGGTDKTKYYGYFGYNHQELEFTKNSGYYDKYNFQANFSTKVFERFKVGMNIQYTRTDKNYTAGGDLFQDGTNFWCGIMYEADPRYPLYLPDRSKLSYANMQNGSPLWAIDPSLSGTYHQIRNNSRVNGFAEYSFKYVPGLKAKANVIFSYNSTYLKWMRIRGFFYEYELSTDEYTFAGSSVEPTHLQMQSDWSSNTVQQYSLDYSGDFNGHHIGALAMFETTLTHSQGFQTKRLNFETSIIQEMSSGEAASATNSSWSSNYGRSSFIGRLNYNYRDKYMVEAIIRGDASSRFSKQYRLGWFPSVSAGWNIAREDFMANATAVDNLKVRASYGMSGYDGVADFNYLTGYVNDIPYTVGGTTVMGLASAGLANELLSWEKMGIFNAGVDFSFWGRKLYGEADFFRRDRTGIPGYRSASLPSTFGATLPQENLNAIATTGFELKLGTAGSAGDFTYDISANISYARSKWTAYDQAEETDPDRARLYSNVGNYTDRQIGYKSDGLFRSQEEVDQFLANTTVYGVDNAMFRPGDLRLVDLNGDGTIDWKDQTEIGKGSTPHWMTGWNFNFGFKGFDLSLLFQGAWGYTYNINFDERCSNYCDLYYRPGREDNALLPCRSTNSVNWYATDLTYRDVAYLRLKNASFGYSLPKTVLKKIGIQKLRIYVGGMNLFTISTLDKYGVDPEAPGATGMAYPQQYTLSAGINLVF